MVKNLLSKKLNTLVGILCFFSFISMECSYAQLAIKSTATSANGAEISAFDPSTNRIFTVAGNAIEYYTLNSAGALSAPTAISYGLTLGVGEIALPNSVAVKNGILAFGFAVVDANNAQQPGRVAFYNPTTATYISDVTVGYLPDMIAFSPDGTKILTANEGEPNSYGQPTSFDPEGSVSIIDISAGIASATVSTASFASFNSQMATLRAAGVRIYGPGATVAQDLEPEYISFIDNATAAVTLQENNAVAMIDIATNTVTSIKSLGLKDHSLTGNGFDASDRDLTSSTGKINIQNWPVKGMYMPDAIASFTSGGNTYFITANEGDSRAYTGFSEEVRVGSSGYVLDSTIFPNATTLKLNANLGRLQLSNATGDTDGDTDFDEIHALGSRSFSIWNSTFGQVFDSGDQLEQITSTQSPTLFNSDGTTASFDGRSDNKGPEPEAVTTGMVNGVQYAFVGSERSGDVFLYDITNPASPVFKQYINTVADLGVEGLIFISAAESPTGNPLLVSSAEVSRTVSVYEFAPPTVDLSVSTTTASETAGTVVTVTATASAPVDGNKTLSVDVSGTNITAADYSLSNATITIPSGMTTGSVTFTVLSDNLVETAETAVVAISSPSAGIALGTTTSQNIAISDYVFTLQVLHASDFEGAVEAVVDAPRFAAIVDKLEDSYVNTIKLSSGDNYIPGPFLSSAEDSSLSAALKTSYENFYNTTLSTPRFNLLPSIGRADISILNFIGIEASALGNHEFDLGTNEVRNIIRGANNTAATTTTWFGAQFPYISSNLNFSGDSNLSAIATTDKLRLNTSFMSNPTETVSAITNKTKLAPSTIIIKGGQKIGIVGCTTQVLASISSPGATTVIGGGANDMNILAGIVQPVVDALIADGCNKIILLSHLQQIAFEKELATKLTGVDIIMAGGSNTLMADANDRLRSGDVAVESYPFLATDFAGKTVPVINTDGNYQYVGRLVVDFDSDGNLIPSSIDSAISGVYAADEQGLNEVWGSNVGNAYAVGTRGYQVQLLCNAVGNVITTKDSNLFGKTSVFLEGRRNFVRTEETNLGNVTAEANLWMAKFYDPSTVISIKNGGGIRSAIGNVIAVGDNVTLSPPIANPSAGKQAGDISQLDIENSLRFNNQLSLVTLTASGLRSILEHAVAATTATATPGQFAQVAGVRYSYNFSNAVGSRILNAVVTDASGNVIDTLVLNGVTQGDVSRTFRVVTLNFLAGGGDSYPFVALSSNRVDLNTLTAQGPGMASFATSGSEQDAFAEYMKSQFNTTPYGVADTSLVNDCRIQRVPARTDNVLPPNAGTNGALDIITGSTVTTTQLFAALGGTPVSGGDWSPALAGAGVYTYTVNSICAGSSTATVAVTETIPTTMTFCQGAKVSDAVGTTTLKFYTAVTRGTLLPGTATLSNRTLFATQMVEGIESTPRVPVLIVINQTSNAGSIGGSMGTICYNSSKTLNVSASARGTVQWNSSASLTGPFVPILGGTSPILNTGNLTANTFYNVVLTNGVCPSSTSAAVEVMVRPEAISGTISGATSVCPDKNRTLLTLSGQLGTIQWQSSTDDVNFTPISPARTGVTFTATNLTVTTYYRVMITNGLGCTPVFSDSVAVTVKALPNAGNITGTSAIAYNTPANLAVENYEVGATLQWKYSTSPTGVFINGRQLINTSDVYTTASLTRDYYYTVAVTKDGCSSTTAPFLVDVASRTRFENGMTSTSSNEFDIVAYPNPSTESFTIQTSSKGAVNVQVYDMQGRLVENTNSTQFGSKLAAGTYNVIVNQGVNVKSLKVIKK